jgi:YD repeat-containing protein
MTLPSGAAIGFGYNANNQVTSVTLNGSTTILNAITYDPFDPITGWNWGTPPPPRARSIRTPPIS